MPIMEDVKEVVERMTGLGGPERQLASPIRRTTPLTIQFAGGGRTPNDPRLSSYPLLVRPWTSKIDPGER